MATGDQQDMTSRLRAVLPPGWFGDDAPVLNAALAGFGAIWAPVFGLWAFLVEQTRIGTATGFWLDIISADFFGSGLPRRAAEGDAAFRTRILREMFRERGTRAAVVAVLTDLTGRAPAVFEPARPADTGGYTVGGFGYGAAGGWGSLLLSFQFFVTAYRGSSAGIAGVDGWGGGLGGYGAGAIKYAGLAMIEGLVTDADIDAAVASVIPEATIAWTAIADNPAGIAAPGPVTGLAATPGVGALAVTWSAPTTGGAATGYTVLYRQTGTTAWTLAAQAVAAPSATITGLTAGTSYDVAVLATNSAGPGPLSGTVTAAPYAATVTMNLAPPASFGHGTAPGFNVAISPNSAGARAAWGTSATVAPGAGWAAGGNYSGNLWAWYLGGGASASAGTAWLWVQSLDSLGHVSGQLVSGPFTVT